MLPPLRSLPPLPTPRAPAVAREAEAAPSPAADVGLVVPLRRPPRRSRPRPRRRARDEVRRGRIGVPRPRARRDRRRARLVPEGPPRRARGQDAFARAVRRRPGGRCRSRSPRTSSSRPARRSRRSRSRPPTSSSSATASSRPSTSGTTTRTSTSAGRSSLVMNNDPEDDPQLFAGKTRLWYGRWDYKYMQAAQKGAAAVLLIHTTHSAGYPWQVVTSSFGHTRVRAARRRRTRRASSPKMWIDRGRERRARGGRGQGSRRAPRRGREARVRPGPARGEDARCPFTQRSSGRSRPTTSSASFRGRDPRWRGSRRLLGAPRPPRHRDDREGRDAIYNGAVRTTHRAARRSSPIARAAAPSEPRSGRASFVAVAAEEQGLLGSEWYAATRPSRPGRSRPTSNIDSRTSMGVRMTSASRIWALVGRRRGRGRSRGPGPHVHGDAFPDQGSYYRSDQFSFAKVGVPGSLRARRTVLHRAPAGVGRGGRPSLRALHYHQPSDEYSTRLGFLRRGRGRAAPLRRRHAHRERRRIASAWKPGDEFEAIRKAAVAAAGR